MRTEKQIAASRANGRKSHGAVTPEGKARIVNANLWTGLFAEDHVLSWEFQEDFDELKDEYYTCHPPHSPEARCLVDQLITCEWHLRRFANAELSVWEDLANNSESVDTTAGAARTGDHVFHRIQSRINATRRAFHTALKELERLEARDTDVMVVPKNPDGVVSYSNENPLPVLGSLRQNVCENPTPVPSALVETGGLPDAHGLAGVEADSSPARGERAARVATVNGNASADPGSKDKALPGRRQGGDRRQASVPDRERESNSDALWMEALANARTNSVPESGANRWVAPTVS